MSNFYVDVKTGMYGSFDDLVVFEATTNEQIKETADKLIRAADEEVTTNAK